MQLARLNLVLIYKGYIMRFVTTLYVFVTTLLPLIRDRKALSLLNVTIVTIVTKKKHQNIFYDDFFAF